MKIINAEWEKRNLGIDVTEIQIESTDTKEDFFNVNSELTSDYVVVKIPSSENKLMSVVQDEGYRFAEDIITVIHDLREVKRNRILQRLYDVTGYRRMTEDDIERLLEELEKGIVDSDRISLDNKFSREQSIRRYVNWAKDLIDSGALPYVILYKDEQAGFVILKPENDGVYQSVLGGSYLEFRNRGTGMIQKEQEIVKSLGGKCVMTAVSSNNISQVKALMENGYMPHHITHIFVKHSK